ncbi:ankyrin repeat domain-containing protein [Candidatus Chromulinivorax destructor]|uniref:Uncharacterized protein n=1 Tax=Candidatus Chromulinivorax destructor TaxID=2066483 RepID=A0A345ZAF2_9BACT|nr:ankyrin repeat domain-containing protein [Candidatus Chromulinivorax destructor]AXK60269.1 hypothetical protein C0J27_00690 [Candidatus Chromulinivorax destructor]
MKKLHMKTNKLLFVLMIGLSSAITVSCSQQDVTPAQMRQNIINDAMKPENYSDLKQDLAFLESQGLLQPDSFYNLLQENVTESQDATFNEVIEKAQDLLTKHMKDEFISTIERALEERKSLDYYIDALTRPLFSYVMQRKYTDMVLYNIAREWLIDIQHCQNFSPLHIAAVVGNKEILQLLVDSGVNVDIQEPKEKMSPLHIAVLYGHTEIVQNLLAARANVHTVNSGGMTPLHIAILNNQKDIVKLLVEYGADINSHIIGSEFTPLHLAAKKGYIEIAKLLLMAGVDINIQGLSGCTPLHIAVEQDQIESINFLVEHGANIDQGTHNGVTPLHFASCKGNAEIVRLLIAAGCNPEISTIRGRSAQEFAKTDEIRDILRRTGLGNNQSQVERCLIS